MNLGDVTKVIYHSNCHDGLASAAIFYSFYQNCDFIPMSHGYKLPELNKEVILFLDFSVPKNEMLELMNYNKVYIIDHHISAFYLKDILPEGEYVLDKSYCGAMLTWKEMYESPEPLLLKYVNDRDLWLNNLPNYKEIFNGLNLEEKTIENFHKLLFDENQMKVLKRLQQVGSIVLKHLESTYPILKKKIFIDEYKGHKVAYLNSPLYQSDLGNYVMENFDVDFAAIYHFNGEKTIFSLRGKDKVNLSEIAQSYNGGGHFNAAGCSISGPVNTLLC